jgi:superfamily I DNA/RNA helicase
MDPAQRNLVDTWPESGFRRIKGSAGSGKSLVLAARAAKLANAGMSVLIITFNITLMHYLRDMVIRGFEKKGASRNVVYRHFHGWCKEICADADMGSEYQSLMSGFLSKNKDVRDRIMNENMPTLAATAIRENGHMLDRYDAILVDEGQDFLPLWLNAVQGLLKPGGQMLLVADVTQDVYGTAKTWTEDAMKKVKFSGPWAQLKTGYRLPLLAQEHVGRFASKFLTAPFDLADRAQGVLNVDRCHMRWIACSFRNAAETCEREIIEMMHHTGTNGLANADITFLTYASDVGRKVIDCLADMGIETMSALDEIYEDRRREKMMFYVGNARVRATTLHSFKGWESRLLVIYLSEANTHEERAAIYVGLTRLKEHPEGCRLTVVSSNTELNNYGRTWPEYAERPERSVRAKIAR